MAINPMKLLQFRNKWNEFAQRHPKFPQFIYALRQRGIEEGTIIEIQVKTADGKELATNLKLTAEDVEILKDFRK